MPLTIQQHNEWISRLENPEAEQCMYHLGEPDGARCCIGVLADIMELEYQYVDNTDQADGRDNASTYKFIDTIIGRRTRLDAQNMNDNHLLFKEIAAKLKEAAVIDEVRSEVTYTPFYPRIDTFYSDPPSYSN